MKFRKIFHWQISFDRFFLDKKENCYNLLKIFIPKNFIEIFTILLRQHNRRRRQLHRRMKAENRKANIFQRLLRQAIVNRLIQQINSFDRITIHRNRLNRFSFVCHLIELVIHFEMNYKPKIEEHLLNLLN